MADRFACDHKAGRRTAFMKKRVLCYGDSNTWGCKPGLGGSFPEDVRWTGVLQRLVGEDYAIIEEGHNGRTTVWDDPIENRMSGLTYFYPCVESQSPLDVIIIALGVNDLKPRFNCAAGSIAVGLGRYFSTLKYVPLYGKEPKVLLVSPAYIHPEYRKNHAKAAFHRAGSCFSGRTARPRASARSIAAT